MTTERERLIVWAKQLADPNWCLSVPKEAKDTITALLKELEPRTVTTIDELDAAVYAAFEDDGHLVLTDRQGRPWIIWADEDGDEVVNSWPQEEDPARLALSDIRLPATVMHHGARTILHELETRA